MELDNSKLLLLAQLVDSLANMQKNLQDFYAQKDKKKFDFAKQALLETQNKITFFLKDL